jgi:hypothetical protein
MARLGSVWAPPRGLWDPSPPVGGKPRPPVAHPGQMGPETRAGPADPAGGGLGEGSGGAIRPHSGGGEGIVPLARLCVGCQAGEAVPIHNPIRGKFVGNLRDRHLWSRF